MFLMEERAKDRMVMLRNLNRQTSVVKEKKMMKNESKYSQKRHGRKKVQREKLTSFGIGKEKRRKRE